MFNEVNYGKWYCGRYFHFHVMFIVSSLYGLEREEGDACDYQGIVSLVNVHWDVSKFENEAQNQIANV